MRYHIASPLAMAACLLAGSLSTLTLIEPALHGNFTLTHWIAVGVAVGLVSLTISTGVLAHQLGRSAAGIALAVLSLAGSGIIVWEQSGRRAQTRDQSAVSVTDTERERARLVQKRSEAEEILTTHRRSQATECASGKGKKCDGVTYTVHTWEAAVAGYDAKLSKLPVVAPDAKSERAATIAGLLGYDDEHARVWVSILDPLATPVWLEWVSIVCGILAFRQFPRRTEITTIPRASTLPVSDRGTPVTPRLLTHVETDEARVVAALELQGGKVHSQRHLSTLLGVSPAETCRMLQKCSRDRIEKIWDPIAKANVIRLRAQAA